MSATPRADALKPSNRRDHEGRVTSATTFLDLRGFRDFGHLQEVNRAYFHPRGMALAVVVDTDTERATLAILDWRDDAEGGYFGWEQMGADGRADSLAKAQRVAEDMTARKPAREAALGFWQQPLPGEEPSP